MRPFVEISDVSLTYPGAGANATLALEHATLSIEKGEFVAVVGPSGCGKSTLLKLVSGLHLPTRGGVIVANREVAAPISIVGMAFQNPVMLPWRTTLDNILLPLEIVEPHAGRFRANRKSYVEKALALLKAVGLEGFGDRYPWQLSGGMQQRASLCRALIHEPALLLLDEPFGALDAFTREELWAVLRDLWAAQRFTVILVTHDLTEAVYLADKVHVCSKRPGRIVTTRNVDLPHPRDKYAPEFVALVRELHDGIAEVRAS
ncbi:ATP-binding cassette domain-containing protein [Bradyrhizobium sp. dw_411]|uniref:ABC transporter ATP-binding protein n=1 Tax=Bradyrhizobium sp. dw_411 TaxID=2720082 RepID=UPI001BD10DC0